MNEIKLRLHNIISKPALQYSGETSVLREEDKRRTETSEMRFPRSVLGVSLRDKIRSKEVRKQLTQTEWWKKYKNTKTNGVIM
jgi:hypothetical protein